MTQKLRSRDMPLPTLKTEITLPGYTLNQRLAWTHTTPTGAEIHLSGQVIGQVWRQLAVFCAGCVHLVEV